jgi:16S rRNA (guanine966-N2)-methyltransferase
VVFVDNDATAVQALRSLLVEWAGEGGEVLRSDAARYLAEGPREFDLVFLDPPFEARLLDGVCAQLAEGGWLAQGARIYIEHARHDARPALPRVWRELRSGSAGEVSYHLHEHGSS